MDEDRVVQCVVRRRSTMAAPSVNIPNAHASVDPVVEPVAGRVGVAVDGDPTGGNPITLT